MFLDRCYNVICIMMLFKKVLLYFIKKVIIDYKKVLLCILGRVLEFFLCNYVFFCVIMIFILFFSYINDNLVNILLIECFIN